MASTSNYLPLGLSVASDLDYAERPDVNSRRALEISSGWRFVTIAVPVGRSQKHEGYWFKSDDSPDWRQVEKPKRLWRGMAPLLQWQGPAMGGVRSPPKWRKQLLRLVATAFAAVAMLAAAWFGAPYRDAVTKPINQILALASPAPTFSADIQEGLANAVMEIRPSLPKRIDQTTTLMWVSYTGIKMIYDYRLEVDGAKIDDVSKMKLAELVRVNTCTAPASRKLLDLGGSYRYVYSDTRAKMVLTVNIEKDQCS